MVEVSSNLDLKTLLRKKVCRDGQNLWNNNKVVAIYFFLTCNTQSRHYSDAAYFDNRMTVSKMNYAVDFGAALYSPVVGI